MPLMSSELNLHWQRKAHTSRSSVRRFRRKFLDKKKNRIEWNGMESIQNDCERFHFRSFGSERACYVDFDLQRIHTYTSEYSSLVVQFFLLAYRIWFHCRYTHIHTQYEKINGNNGEEERELQRLNTEEWKSESESKRQTEQKKMEIEIYEYFLGISLRLLSHIKYPIKWKVILIQYLSVFGIWIHLSFIFTVSLNLFSVFLFACVCVCVCFRPHSTSIHIQASVCGISLQQQRKRRTFTNFQMNANHRHHYEMVHAFHYYFISSLHFFLEW